ncbi:MAG: ECF transporter S component [Bacilli bacterium]|jgi:uncharacterized membrane protein|nr:ECF transporter S component [Bacilli bacterium]
MNLKTRDIVYIGMLACLTLVGTFINFRLPFVSQGGLVHLGTPIAIIGVLTLGTKRGMFGGAIGMAVFDIIGGWFIWAPATFIARLGLGYLFGKIAFMKDYKGNNYLINILGLIIGGIWMLLIYYIFESIVYNNWIASLGSIPGNLMQLLLSLIIGIPIGMILKRQFKFNEK